MSHRYAILDDNQRLLAERIARLRVELPDLICERMCAAMIIGSVAAGRARDESDIDLLLVLRQGSPRRTDYQWWDENVQARLLGGGPQRFPVQPLIISRQSLSTREPNLRSALDTGIPIWDPEALFHDQPEARA